MAKELVFLSVHHQFHMPRETSLLLVSACSSNICLSMGHPTKPRMRKPTHQPVMMPVPPRRATSRRKSSILTTAAAGGAGGGASVPLLDLTEDNVRHVLADARVEFGQMFDDSVGITGQAELTELDGPFVKISLKGRFWHKRSTVLARLGNYLKQRIPEILEVDIEDEKQLDDSPENF